MREVYDVRRLMLKRAKANRYNVKDLGRLGNALGNTAIFEDTENKREYNKISN